MDNIVSDFESFENVFSNSFYKKVVKETLIPIKMSKQEFQNTLIDLYKDIINGNYSPSILRGRIFTYKNNNVARIIPCLTIRDEALYFFLVKLLEEDIATNRIDGTFGGWRLGNAIKELENLEIEYVTNSYNPKLWNKNWKEFSNIVWAKIRTDVYDVAYSLDIANFYDNINLNILEKKLLATVGRKKSQIVYLLIYFLKYWNKSIDNYNYKTVGIPQSEFGDQSRLLANFYLQDYDSIISELCLEQGAEYVRYADDQIIFARNDTDINRIMLSICNELNKIGLNVNASKVHKYTMEELETYYGYEMINDILEENYDSAANTFFALKDNNVKFREDIILRKMLTSGLNNYSKENKDRILSIVTTDDFLLHNGLFYLKKVYGYINEEEKEIFIERLIFLLQTNYYNEFHYSVLKFAKENKLDSLVKIAMDTIRNIPV
ncbi:putative retron type reverse transcriptase [Firmicutes bacterium CAG:822]|nr:putative retron type reverse transcriptase [Firmicutes bacterium CAG:822]